MSRLALCGAPCCHVLSWPDRRALDRRADAPPLAAPCRTRPFFWPCALRRGNRFSIGVRCGRSSDAPSRSLGDKRGFGHPFNKASGRRWSDAPNCAASGDPCRRLGTVRAVT